MTGEEQSIYSQEHFYLKLYTYLISENLPKCNKSKGGKLKKKPTEVWENSLPQ